MSSSALTPSGTTCKDLLAFSVGEGRGSPSGLVTRSYPSKECLWGASSELSKRDLTWSREDFFCFKAEL